MADSLQQEHDSSSNGLIPRIQKQNTQNTQNTKESTLIGEIPPGELLFDLESRSIRERVYLWFRRGSWRGEEPKGNAFAKAKRLFDRVRDPNAPLPIRVGWGLVTGVSKIIIEQAVKSVQKRHPGRVGGPSSAISPPNTDPEREERVQPRAPSRHPHFEIHTDHSQSRFQSHSHSHSHFQHSSSSSDHFYSSEDEPPHTAVTRRKPVTREKPVTRRKAHYEPSLPESHRLDFDIPDRVLKVEPLPPPLPPPEPPKLRRQGRNINLRTTESQSHHYHHHRHL